jgi:hypothetical protein
VILVPVIAMAVIVSEAVPVFLSVTVLAVLVVPIATVPKLKLVGESATIGTVLKLKVAVTDLDEVIVTEQLPVPLQAPLQPAKTDPDAAVAVRPTNAPLANIALQVVGQLMPAGLLVTLPLPVPASETVKGKTAVKVAVTALAAFMVTEHPAVPEQAPLQPVNAEPAAGVSVNVTTVPLMKFALHVPGQLMPAGLLVTVPVPLPAKVTVSGKITLKVAVTDFEASMVTEQEPLPEQAPLQPVKMEPAAACAVRVTRVPSENPNTHLPGQLMPAGLLVTEP